MTSTANKGVIDKIEQQFFIDGRPVVNSDVNFTDLHLYTFRLTEYKKGILMRTTNFGMYLRKNK